MAARDLKDLIGGGLLASLGLLVTVYSLAHYDYGSVMQVGPGFFPAAMGGLLLVLGLIILVPAARRHGTVPSIDLVPLLACAASIAIFALTVAPFGLVPAMFAMVVPIVLTDERLGWVSGALLATVLSGACALVFRQLLSIPFTLFQWPF